MQTLDPTVCWLHGGKQRRLECQGCIANFEMDRDLDAIEEMEAEF